MDEFDAGEQINSGHLIMQDIVAAPVGNYYGGPYVWVDRGFTGFDARYYMTVENFRGYPTVEISKDFYDAFVTEFREEGK